MFSLIKRTAATAVLFPCLITVCHAQTIVLPPVFPKPSAPQQVVGVIFLNTARMATPGGYVTFGQVFAPGTVQATDQLSVVSGAAAQMDALSLWPDGTVKLGAITAALPPIAAGISLPAMIAKGSVPGGLPVNLAGAAIALSVDLTFIGQTNLAPRHIDIGAALKAKLLRTPAYWLKGPLATQARVDVGVTASLHLLADVTMYADGSIAADVQFNNDLTMKASGGTLSYNANIVLGSSTYAYNNITHYQYQDWHAVLTQPSLPALNVQHDPAYLQSTGAVLPYNLALGVSDATLQIYAAMAAKPGFGQPLNPNGVTQNMTQTGGRADIGWTTQYNTVWLITQDARAATVALAQGDAAGAVPWNMKLANGHWLNTVDYPLIWVDQRAAQNGLTGLTQWPVADAACCTEDNGWAPDAAHEPNLAYVPYLMTARRWYLDRLNTEAMWGLVTTWPALGTYQASGRCAASVSVCDIVTASNNQLRAQAWSMREVVLAAWIGHPGSFEGNYFGTVATDNWKYILSQSAGLSAAQGDVAGWLPGTYGAAFVTTPWQQDFFAGIAAWATLMGDSRAAQVLAWEHSFLVGRFTAPGANPYDGCIYNMYVQASQTGTDLKTWADVEAATVAAGASRGTAWPAVVGDYYCQESAGVLSVLRRLSPGDPLAQQALTWLLGSQNPQINAAAYQADPTWSLAQ